MKSSETIWKFLKALLSSVLKLLTHLESLLALGNSILDLCTCV